MEIEPAPILILGLGNELLGDDAIGIRLVSELEKQYKTSFTHFRTSCIGGLEIVEIITGYELVVIIDAIKTLKGIPGSVYRLTPADFLDSSHVSSFHDISFLTALKFAAYLDIKIPQSIHILAIEIVEDMTFTNHFSRQIQLKYKNIRKQIENHLYHILNEKYIPEEINR